MNSKPAESFGACLYAIRVQKDQSQREMAKRLSISAAYVGAIENERRFPPSVQTARQWAEQLQLNSSARAKLLAACAREQRSKPSFAGHSR